jgi:hypothetical protein
VRNGRLDHGTERLVPPASSMKLSRMSVET